MNPAPIPSTLCAKCRVLSFDDSALGTSAIDSRSGGSYFRIHAGSDYRPFLEYELEDVLPDLPVLSGSARRGCGFCGLLRGSIGREIECLERDDREEKEERERKIRVQLQLVFSPEHEGRFISVLARVGVLLGGGWSEETLFLFGVDGIPGEPCTQWLRLQSSPQDNVLCSKNVNQLRAMLRETESRVSSSSRTAFRPTRLVHIGDSEDDVCRLVVSGPGSGSSADADLRPQYAALSYCWGPPADARTQFKTSRVTLRDRVAGFPLAATSPIMRDALVACRVLGLQYLWIDAVCIVQDDREDWAREAAAMADVYRGACVTLCTPSSTSCREGILGTRVSARIGFRSGIDSTTVGTYTIRACGAIADARLAGGDYGTLDRGDTSPRSNWWKRGWTYQELRLSRRVLLFGHKLLVDFESWIWAENDEEMTEVVVGAVPEERAEGEEEEEEREGEGGGGGVRSTFAGISLTGALDTGDEWMSMVEEYTARQLTFESDKLPAMGGLARIEMQDRGDQYLAGIRRDSLHRDVFWTPESRTDADGKGDPRISFDSLLQSLNSPNPYVAPSWSWARWKGKVRFDESPAPYGDHVPVREGDSCFAKAYERIESWTSVSKSNPFGQVTGGGLRLTGTVVPVLPQLERQDGFDNHWEMYDSGQYVANLTFDWDEPADRVPFERLSLVLVGSYWSWDAYKTAKLNNYVEMVEDSLDNDIEMGEDVDVDMSSSEEDDGGGDDGDEDLSDESEIGFEDALERDKDVDKFAYGLIIHPAEERGKYFRVGVFTSWPKGMGGLRRFPRERDTRRVEII
ncbi:hypothetical protein AAE478_007374 [Parahypoxylon ruwenzoriense]